MFPMQYLPSSTASHSTVTCRAKSTGLIWRYRHMVVCAGCNVQKLTSAGFDFGLKCMFIHLKLTHRNAS